MSNTNSFTFSLSNPSMATLLSISHCFSPTKKNNTTASSNQELIRSRNCPRFLVLVACQTHKSVDTSTTLESRRENRGNKNLFSQILSGVERFGKGLKKKMSPEQKGDWKDLVLMSISFAVYVYISQQIVSAYFAWMSMPTQQSW